MVRTGQIESLVVHFMKKYAARNDKIISGIDQTALSYLKLYSYPGNVRELENIIERAVVLCKGEVLTVAELPDSVTRRGPDSIEIPATAKELGDMKRKLWKETILPIEREFIVHLLEKSDGNISEAARLAGFHRKHAHSALK